MEVQSENDGVIDMAPDQIQQPTWDGLIVSAEGVSKYRGDGTSMAATEMKSANYLEGIAGWRITSAGNAYFQDVDIGARHITVSPGEDIQAAVDAVSAGGGGTVFLKNGTHTRTTNIDVPSSVYIVGQNNSAAIVDFANNSAGFRFLGSNNYSTGTVDATKGSTTVTGTDTVWTAAMVGRYIMLSGLWYQIAARVSNTEITLAFPYSDANLDDASYMIASVVKDVRINDLTITRSLTYGIQFQYAYVFWIKDVIITSSAYALKEDYCSNQSIFDLIMIGNAYGADFDNVHFSDIQTPGAIYTTTGDGLNFNTCTNLSVKSAYCANAAANGISLTSCSDFGILASTMNGCTGKGVELVSGNDNILFTGGGAQNSGSDGIKLTATSDNCIITGGVFNNSGGYGINIAASSCDNNIISSNTLIGNSTASINDLGTDTILSANAPTSVNPSGNGIVASANLKVSADTAQTSTSEAYEMKKEIIVRLGGTARIKFDLKTGNEATTAYGRIYINGVAVGTEQTAVGVTTYTTYSQDLSVSPYDLVQLYVKTSAGGTTSIQNFRLYFDYAPLDDYTVNTD